MNHPIDIEDDSMKINTLLSDINFIDHPIQTPPSLPSPNLKKDIKIFLTSSRFLKEESKSININYNKIEKIVDNKSSCNSLAKNTAIRTRSSSPYRIWANKLITNSKEQFGECFGTPQRICARPARTQKRDEYGLIQCTQIEMEELWANKQSSQNFNKMSQKNF